VTAALLIASVVVAWSSAQTPTCTTANECRQLARDAVATQQFERAHDLAWLAYQKGSRTDPDTLVLLARAQSLSGRGDDAFVMLRRLAQAGVVVDDVATSDDFQRVRAHAQWAELLAAFEALKAARSKPSATTDTPVTPAPPAGAPTPATPPETSTAIGPTPASSEGAPPEVISVDAVRAHEDLAVPGLSFTPAAMAYDAVSARFILSAVSSDALTVLSQTSNNAAALTSRGWSGLEKATALTIDRAAGDLWVAAHGDARARLHRLQLISGRRLDVVDVPGDGPSEIISLTLSRGVLFALDRAGRRILRRTPSSTSLESFLTLPKDITPVALAHTSNALYVAHAEGLSRIDVASRRQQPVRMGKAGDVAGLESIAWHDGVLIGIQHHDGGRRVVRLSLNARGTAITRAEVLGPAASHVATLGEEVFYYLTDDAQGRRVVRAINVK
jgi:hypothetical protein